MPEDKSKGPFVSPVEFLVEKLDQTTHARIILLEIHLDALGDQSLELKTTLIDNCLCTTQPEKALNDFGVGFKDLVADLALVKFRVESTLA